MMCEEWISAEVVHGFRNGTKFGFPTANLNIKGDCIIDNGVYAVVVNINDCFYKGMFYVGTRPSLHLLTKTFEIHILNFSSNIYGETIKFKMVGFVRFEYAFSSVDKLIEQLKQDKAVIDKMIKLPVKEDE